ncbi:hypothetical protein FSP39_014495 [Pinctada imbricata]|uniref:DNA-binding protein SATB1 n=1 Tax=Pinctada imbricata TaxID=66713 RepID=A0AA88XMD9_PINIB|nr:hypothetical protein FSP39_014495 [Pinctada imbricata]
MDFHAAMETFAEAWVAANTQTAVNSDPQAVKSTSSEELPTLLSKDQLTSKSTEHQQQPPGQTQHSPPVGAGVKSLPIHCVIEQTTGPLTFEADSSGSSNIELDSYAILPSSTLFSELVRTSLVKLGYSATETINAKGAIQIKNWKPLSFDIITSDKNASLDDILGELTQVATLRIRLCSQTKVSSAEEIKGKLLQLLLTQSQDLLLKAGCPIEKSLLSSISMGEHLTHLPSEIRKSFDKWYREELLKSQKLMENSVTVPEASPDKLRMVKTPPSDPLPNSQSPSSMYMPLVGKTRMRTSFDPEHEIPRLQKWFQENQHPPRELMIRYLDELNSLDSRKGRRPLDLTNIIYWFKNARAAHRRASRCFEGDGGFEMEESQDLSPSGSDTNHSFLNKHPLYMLPYAYAGMYGSHDMSCDMKEPCDLSQGSKTRNKDASPVEEEKKGEAKVLNQIKSDEVKASANEEMDIKKESEEIEKDDNKGSELSPKHSDASMPVLPNKNAVYVLPYPYHGKDQERNDGSQEDRKPCDLTHSNKSKSSQNESLWKKEVGAHDKENRICIENSHRMDEEDELIHNGGIETSKGMLSDELPQSYTEGMKHVESNGVYRSGSEGEEMQSDYDDDQSFDGSESSHDTSSLSIKQENHDDERGFHGNKLSQLQQSASTGLHQPLHIPHFPHPLAMHYFPMNSHFLQQTARYQQHQHQQLSPPDDHHKTGLSDSHLHSNSHHRKRRTRVFIDPMSEIPKLEKWFAEDTHPSSYMIDKYCEELNRSEYRQKFPKLEAKNVQLWFKNHRAKVKRMKVSSVDLHNVTEFSMK